MILYTHVDRSWTWIAASPWNLRVHFSSSIPTVAHVSKCRSGIVKHSKSMIVKHSFLWKLSDYKKLKIVTAHFDGQMFYNYQTLQCISVIYLVNFVGQLCSAFRSAWQEAPEQSARALSSGAASAHEAFANHFCVQIVYMYKFLILECRNFWDLGQCSSWHLANRMLQCNGQVCFNQAVRRNSESIPALCSGFFLARCQELHRRQARSPVQIEIRYLFDIRPKR